MDAENTIDDDDNNNCFQYEYHQVSNIIDEDEQSEMENNIEYIEYNNDNSDIIYDGICIEGIEDNEYNVIEENDNQLIDSDNASNDEEVYYCNTCNLNFKDLEKHISNYHLNQSVMIDAIKSDENSTIDKSNDIETEVNNPINKTDDNDTNQFWCEHCDLGFNKKLLLKNHIKSKHSDIKNTENMESLDNNLEKPKHENVECLVCNKMFNSVKSLKVHGRIHKSTELKNLLQDTKCSICNTIFLTAKSLKLHSRMHEPIELKSYKKALGHEYKKHFKNIKYFKCDICEKRFDCKLKEEHKKFHQSDKKLNEFMCTKCNKKFSNETNFTMHLKLHESQIDKPKKPTKAEAAGITLPYACQYCGRGFGRPHEKVKHERIHTGEKPFKCEVCGKSFRVTYSLTLHLRTHTAARPYVCSLCNKSFKSYSVYSHHLLTHSDKRPYKCTECPKTFKTSVQLHGHKNSHTKPFNCPECTRPFATMYAVKTHMETHKKGNTSVKNRCLICGATYSRTFGLKDHMRDAHSSNFLEKHENDIDDENDDENDIENDDENDILPGEIVLMEEDHTAINDGEVETSTFEAEENCNLYC